MYRTHEMRMVRTAESGLEEWACPTCGRRILLRWPPHYVKHVLDTGDEQACHLARTPDNTPGDTPGTAAPAAPETATAEGAAAGAAERHYRRRLRETAALARPSEPV